MQGTNKIYLGVANDTNDFAVLFELVKVSINALNSSLILPA